MRLTVYNSLVLLWRLGLKVRVSLSLEGRHKGNKIERQKERAVKEALDVNFNKMLS
jgi:hypothetical protein